MRTTSDNTSAKVNMESVRFYSQDKKHNPMTLTVPKVVETDAENQIITLYQPVATYVMKDGTVLTSQSPDGLLYQRDEKLLLEHQVTTTSTTGYKALASLISVDNKESVISSTAPISITGPMGQLKADGFKLWDKGSSIDFTGKTDTTIHNKKGKMRVKSTGGLEVRQDQQTLTANQNVSVKQGDKIITADKMVLTYYTKRQNKNNRIQKIEAFGHVVAHNDTHKITGNHGVYDPQKGIVIMTGDVVVSHGRSHMEGEQATLNLNTSESTLTPKKNQKSGRIRGTLVPSDLKGK